LAVSGRVLDLRCPRSTGGGVPRPARGCKGKNIRTTKRTGAYQQGTQRRSRVIGAFPNDGALLRLGVTILMDINDEWLTGRKYLSMIEE